MKFTIYQELGGWCWNLKTNESEIIAVSVGIYLSIQDCKQAIRLVQEASSEIIESDALTNSFAESHMVQSETFEIYQRSDSEWFWSLRSRDGEMLSISAQSYRNKADCLFSVALVQESKEATIQINK